MPPKYSDDQLLRCMLILSSRDDNGIRVPLSSSANDEAAGSNTPVTITDTLLLSAAIALREVSHSNLPRILFLFDSWDNNVGFHSVLIRILRSTSSSSISPLPTAIVFNVLWMVTEVISYGMNHSYTKLMELGILPLMIEKLEDEDMNIVEQAGWGLGNLAGDSTKQRDLIYEADGVAAALRAVRNPKLHAGGRWKITWAMSNLCRGMPSPRPEQVTDLLSYFTEVMMKFIDSRIENGDDTGDFERETVDVLWGICYLSEGGDDEVPYGVDALSLIVEVMSIPQGIDEPGFGNAPVMNRLVPCEQMSYAMEYLPRPDLERLCMLNSDIWHCCVCANRRLYNRVRSAVCHNSQIRAPVIRILGNVTSGSDEQTQAAIECGALRVLESVTASLLMSNHRLATEWKEVCWILSNILAGTTEQATRVLQNTVFYTFVLDALRLSDLPEASVEALWAVRNALESVPQSVPLSWVAAAFGCLATNGDAQGMSKILVNFLTVLTTCPLSVVPSTSPEVIITPQSFFDRSDNYSPQQFTADTAELTDLMNSLILPFIKHTKRESSYESESD